MVNTVADRLDALGGQCVREQRHDARQNLNALDDLSGVVLTLARWDNLTQECCLILRYSIFSLLEALFIGCFLNLCYDKVERRKG